MTQISSVRTSLPGMIREVPLPHPFPVPAAPLLRAGTPAVPEPGRRSKIWEFDPSLHCSIIGTCLSTAELRQILRKLGLTAPESTDHTLHATAVSLASRHDQATRLLNKALDRRHHAAITRFAKAGNEEEVRALWRASVACGEIPGAYWAALTHPATTRTLIREAFGEVHMLSHLVGAANRADIRRLAELERREAALAAKLERQQDAFREAVTGREKTIHELREALAGQMRAPAGEKGTAEDGRIAALSGLIADLEKRLAVETRRRLAAEERLARLSAACDREHRARMVAEQQNREFRTELDAAETLLKAPAEDASGGLVQPSARLDGVALLYVGGRAAQIAHLRALSARLGADLLHHDGGKEQHPDLLGGLVSRADLILFPVDCVSHEAATAVKRLCRQAGKPFIPLRSASLTSFAAALAGVASEAHLLPQA